jgi:hypothetical protein
MTASPPPNPPAHQAPSRQPRQPAGSAVSPPINRLAIASLILGILWLFWLGSILALIFGYLARKQIRERGEGGENLALAGIVLGWVGIVLLLMFPALFVFVSLVEILLNGL